jgi:hypothetical protein
MYFQRFKKLKCVKLCRIRDITIPNYGAYTFMPHGIKTTGHVGATPEWKPFALAKTRQARRDNERGGKRFADVPPRRRLRGYDITQQ